MTDSPVSLCWAGALSLALHLLTFSLPQLESDGPENTAPPATPRSLQLHWRTPPPVEQLAAAQRQLLHSPVGTPRALPSPRQLPPSAVVEPPSPLAAPSAAAIREEAAGSADALSPPRYYLRSEVDRMPQIVEDVAAAGTPLAQWLSGQAGLGRVVIELWIGENGQVDRSEIVIGELPAESVQEVRTAFSRARFTPARRGERAVASRLKIELSVFDAAPEASAAPRGPGAE